MTDHMKLSLIFSVVIAYVLACSILLACELIGFDLKAFVLSMM
jgi:hypothetical protein